MDISDYSALGFHEIMTDTATERQSGTTFWMLSHGDGVDDHLTQAGLLPIEALTVWICRTSADYILPLTRGLFFFLSQAADLSTLGPWCSICILPSESNMSNLGASLKMLTLSTSGQIGCCLGNPQLKITVFIAHLIQICTY